MAKSALQFLYEEMVLAANLPAEIKLEEFLTGGFRENKKPNKRNRKRASKPKKPKQNTRTKSNRKPDNSKGSSSDSVGATQSANEPTYTDSPYGGSYHTGGINEEQTDDEPLDMDNDFSDDSANYFDDLFDDLDIDTGDEADAYAETSSK